MKLIKNPSDLIAEKNLIALTLLNKRIPDGARDISCADFYSGTNRAIWAAFTEMDADGQEIEPFGAYRIFKQNANGLADSFRLSDLSNMVVGMIYSNETVFVNQIKQTARRRFVMRELDALIESAQTGDNFSFDNLKEKLETLETSKPVADGFKSLSEIFETDVRPAIANLRQGITNRISTGFENIDKIIGGGLSVSDVMVVAALTGAGKSAFVLQLATNIAKQNIPVAFVSGEMTNKENGLRLLSQASKFHNLNSAVYISENDADYLGQWLDELKKLPIYFNSTTFDLFSLSKQLKYLVEKHGVKVVVIDYLQLYKMTKHEQKKRTERIADTSQEVARLAMELGVAIIEVVQFNREGSKSIKTSMYDLEGSSQLEKDASLICIIDRETDTEIKLRIVKGRNTGSCELRGTFEGRILNFEF